MSDKPLDDLAYRVRKLETDEPPIVYILVAAAVSTPPTQLECDAAFGATAADVRDGWAGIIYDAIAATVWLVVSTNDTWWPIGGGGGAGVPHDLLSPTHLDTVVNAPSRGSLIYGDATPLWNELLHPVNPNQVLTCDAADVMWSGWALVGTPGSTYTFPAVGGTIALGAGTVTSVTINDATIANHTHALDNTGVGAGIYGSATQSAQITVDLKGRITNAVNVAISGVPPTAHDILSAAHGDTLAAAVSRGSLIYGNVTPAWAELVLGGAAGSFVRRDATDVMWSTLVLPNAATTGDILYATGANTIGNLADVAVGSALVSGGVGIAPAWSASPTLTGLTLSGLTPSTVIYSNAARAITSLANAAGYLYNNGAGALSWAATAVPTAHAILSASHSDATVQAVSRGSLIYGDVTPTWNELVHPAAANRVLQTTALDVQWSAQTFTLTTALTNQGAAGILNWSGAFTLTIPATGTCVLGGGSGANTRVAYWTDANTISSDAGMTYDAANDSLSLLSSVSAKPVFEIQNTNVDTVAPTIEFYKNSDTPDDADDLGAIDFYGETSTGAKERYAYILAESLDVTNGDTGGHLKFAVVMDATERSFLELAGYNGSVNQGEFIVNQNGQDIDTRIEAVGVADALQVRGSDGQITLGVLTQGIVMSDAGGVLSVTAGTPVLGGGSGAATRVAYWADANTLTSDAGFTYTAATDSVNAGDFYVTDGGQFGIIGNELLTVNAAGTFAFSGISGVSVEDADWIGNGAASALLGFNSAGATDYAYFSNCFVGIGDTTPDGHLTIYDNATNTTATYYGIYNFHQKTAGVTDASDDLYGIYNDMRFNQAGGVLGDVHGIYCNAQLTDGTIEYLRGVLTFATITGGTINNDLYAIQGFANVDGGTVTGLIAGLYSYVEIEAAATCNGGIYGVYVWVDDDDNTSTSYMVYLNEQSNIDYGIYQNGTANNYFGGAVGIGTTSVGLSSAHLSVYDAAVSTTTDYYGIYNSHTKTAGATTSPDSFYGYYGYANYNDADTNVLSAYGIYSYIEASAGTATNIYGTAGFTYLTGGTSTTAVGAYGKATLVTGSISLAYGLYGYAYAAATMTAVNGLCGLYVGVDDDFGASGTNYAIYIYEGTNVDYGIYQSGSATNAFGGHIIPINAKTQDLGDATHEWDDLYYVTAHSGTSRLINSKRNCPVCGEQMKRGTGTTYFMGEEADYAVAFCLKCGAMAVEEANHLPDNYKSLRDKAPRVVVENIRVKSAGRHREVAVDFSYGDGAKNSTRLGEDELAQFLNMDDNDKENFLYKLVMREWHSREENRLMKNHVAPLEAQLADISSRICGRDLQNDKGEKRCTN